MGTKIAHIGIAVKSIEKALPFYRDVLGLPVSAVVDTPAEGIKIAFINIGESNLELMEPLEAESAVGKFLEKRGEGIHHLAIKVDDIREALRKATQAGFQLIDAQPRTGAGGTLVAFVHPKSANGVLLELCEGEPQHH